MVVRVVWGYLLLLFLGGVEGWKVLVVRVVLVMSFWGDRVGVTIVVVCLCFSSFSLWKGRDSSSSRFGNKRVGC